MRMFKNQNELIQFHFCQDANQFKKAIFKNTACGAWVDLDNPAVVRVGSIVEGVDECAEIQVLEFPFSLEDFEKAVNTVEQQVSEIWDATHGCEDCGEVNPDTGYIPINPDCQSCHGEGDIL